jgi:hypothetical protein
MKTETTFALTVLPNPSDYGPEAVRQAGCLRLDVRGSTPLREVIAAVGEYNPVDPPEDAWQDLRRLDGDTPLQRLGLGEQDTFLIDGGTGWRVEVERLYRRLAGAPFPDVALDDRSFNYYALQEVQELADWKFGRAEEGEPQTAPPLAWRVVVHGWVRDGKDSVPFPVSRDWRQAGPLTLGRLPRLVYADVGERLPHDRGCLTLPVKGSSSGRRFDVKCRAAWEDTSLDSLALRPTAVVDPGTGEVLQAVVGEYRVKPSGSSGVQAELKIEIHDNAAWLRCRGVDAAKLFAGLAAMEV